MKDVMASLPEVIKEYKGYNLLIPTATDVQLNPFYKFHVEEVAVDLSETSGDIFKVGSVDTGRKDDKVRLSLPVSLYQQAPVLRIRFRRTLILRRLCLR